MSLSFEGLPPELRAKISVYAASVVVCPDMATADAMRRLIKEVDLDGAHLVYTFAAGTYLVVVIDEKSGDQDDAGTTDNP